MQISIPSPRHYESYYGASESVRSYLDLIEKNLEETLSSEAIDILRISLLIAHPEELAQGKFLPYESFDWRCRYVSVGVNGDFERYHLGDDLNKISVISEMLQDVFTRVGKKRKAKFNSDLANQIVIQITHVCMENSFEK